MQFTTLQFCIVILIVISIPLVTWYSPTTALNILNGTSKFKTLSNTAYGQQPRQTFDLYEPSNIPTGCLIAFAHGGSWENGEKELYGFIGAALAKRGHTVIIPNYRLYPTVKFPEFVEDFALSLSHPSITQLRQKYPLVLMGHSAGAMLAGLVSFDLTYLEKAGMKKADVSAYISMSGPHDFFLPSEKPRWVNIFGRNPEQQQQALVVKHIHPDNPPTLLLHGANDTLVVPESATSVANQLKAVGVKAKAIIYKNVGHKDIIIAASKGLTFLAPTLNDIDEFLAPICQKN